MQGQDGSKTLPCPAAHVNTAIWEFGHFIHRTNTLVGLRRASVGNVAMCSIRQPLTSKVNSSLVLFCVCLQRHKNENNKLQQELWLSSDCSNISAIKATECAHFVSEAKYWFNPDSTSWSSLHSIYWRTEWSIYEKVKTISRVVDLLFKSFT